APSSVLLHGPTARERACRHYTFSASPTDPRSSVDTPELSQFTHERFRRVRGVYDPGDPALDSRIASVTVLPSHSGNPPEADRQSQWRIFRGSIPSPRLPLSIRLWRTTASQQVRA